MGIPFYFMGIVRDCKDVMLKKIKAGKTHAYFDFNCLIHPCCRQILKDCPKLIDDHFTTYSNNDNKIQEKIGIYSKLEKKMFESVVEFIENLYNFAQPKKLLYIAIDGVAPRAKMEQQRTRRFKSIN